MIEVWAARLDRSPADVERSAALLTEAEHGRARAFHFDRDRERWIVSRASLRMLLERWTGEPAREIEIVVSESGKPRLVSGKLEFNLSHSAGHALIALSDEGPVGVDIEQFSRGRGIDDCRGGFLHANEERRLIEGEARFRELIKIWCAKEAWLKAVGTGFLTAPQSLEVLWHDEVHAKIESSPSVTLFDIHLFELLEATDLCAAAALPAGSICPAVRWFDA